MEENEISKVILDAAIAVHNELGGPGLLESYYENALKYELQSRGLKVLTQMLVPVTYKGCVIGEPYRLDMLVEDKDRAAFYRFIREHLEDDGVALICTMGDGSISCSSDISTAFDLQERTHTQTGEKLLLAGTSCRMVNWDTFLRELQEAGLALAERGLTSVEPDFSVMMYAVVRKS